MHILECLVFGEWPRDTRHDPVAEKVCPRCGKVKPVSDFGAAKDGKRLFLCRECVKGKENAR